jgi:hypothetical protein
MTRMRTTAVWAVLVATGVASAACGAGDDATLPTSAPDGTSASASAVPPAEGSSAAAPTEAGSVPPDLSSTVPPELTPPSGPPQGPTDLVKKAGWIAGAVTRGGSGPCFGMVTDEGVEYAMHSTEPRTLTKGSRILVRVVPSRLRIDCGPGKQVQVQALEAVA